MNERNKQRHLEQAANLRKLKCGLFSTPKTTEEVIEWAKGAVGNQVPESVLYTIVGMTTNSVLETLAEKEERNANS